MKCHFFRCRVHSAVSRIDSSPILISSMPKLCTVFVKNSVNRGIYFRRPSGAFAAALRTFAPPSFVIPCASMCLKLNRQSFCVCVCSAKASNSSFRTLFFSFAVCVIPFLFLSSSLPPPSPSSSSYSVPASFISFNPNRFRYRFSLFRYIFMNDGRSVFFFSSAVCVCVVFHFSCSFVICAHFTLYHIQYIEQRYIGGKTTTLVEKRMEYIHRIEMVCA